MCGIAGILNFDGTCCLREHVKPLIDAIANRGPDGWGIHCEGPVGLGHRRLAILDLSDAGHQPMQFGDRYWITYNGEVYNFIELRQELEAAGVAFYSGSDTEVILAAYHAWGPDFVLKMNGMWAFAIWDSVQRQLFLSRDRFGVKPLHYLAEPRRFVFASELKSFLHLDRFTARENEEEMCRQLAAKESREETLIEGVKLLRAGHNMLVSEAGVKIWRWWRTLDHIPAVPKRYSDQVDRFRELFFDACRLRLRSDVPISTCLSGGLDSSSILCSLAAINTGGGSRLARDFHRAFVATFDGTQHDETAYAEAAIARAGADARFRPMAARALAADLGSYAHDVEVISEGLLVPVWALYRELRRDGVYVSLDGLGADELLMGYGAALRTSMLTNSSVLKHPFRTYDLARTVHRQFPEDESVARLMYLSDPALQSLGDKVRQLRGRTKVVKARPVSPESAWIKPVSTEMDEFDIAERKSLEGLTPMNRMLYWQFHHGINHSLLRKYDRMSMSHGIEVRMPFMDWRLATYCFGLPDEAKAGGGYSKRILRDAMKGILPEKIRTRTVKIGFQSPLAEWMNGDLGEWMWERVQTKRFLESPAMDGRAIRDFIAPIQAAKRWTDADARRVWRYLQADLWRESFFEKRLVTA
jgi:asparagine synthase (glutamine-hydrolysing)